jgi:hypothetical protein
LCQYQWPHSECPVDPCQTRPTEDQQDKPFGLGKKWAYYLSLSPAGSTIWSRRDILNYYGWYLVPLPSAWKDMHLKSLVHSFISHGIQKRSLYLHQGQFSCGPDFAVSLLHLHLTLHIRNPAAGCTPHTLYLQFDNCSCENKNKLMLADCHWLLWNGVFRHITIYFLPVGHTHEDWSDVFHLSNWNDLQSWSYFSGKLYPGTFKMVQDNSTTTCSSISSGGLGL